MQKAIDAAKKSGQDVTVGAVIVKSNDILAISCNHKEKDLDVTSHAEINAIRIAEEKLGNWRLDYCDLYVTLEPCPMCAWAILQSRIKNVYFGSYDNIYGAFASKMNLNNFSEYKTNVKGGILEKECNNLIKDYFKGIRNGSK